MAIDHHLATICHDYQAPVLRFYGWQPFCISIGVHQDISIVNVDHLNRDGLDLVRRPTGGRAILHAEELTYSVVVPRKLIQHKDLYYFFHRIFLKSLNALGYELSLKYDSEKLPGIKNTMDDFPCFTKSAQTEVQYNEKKIIGSAQKIYKNSILQHGSILIGKMHEKLADYLTGDNRLKEMVRKDIKERTISLGEIKKRVISQEKIIETITNQLEIVNNISLNFKDIQTSERAAAEKDLEKFQPLIKRKLSIK
jgi:lipoate-protein ligase A